MNNLTIRKMRKEDVEEVVKIEKNIFSSPWSEKSFIDALESNDNIYLVAVYGKKIVGYCGLWISYDVADLCNLAVALAYRHQSIGKKILVEGIKLVKERQTERILLEVRESNGSAIGLYQKIGFTEIGKRNNYYSNPTEDAILMEKYLK